MEANDNVLNALREHVSAITERATIAEQLMTRLTTESAHCSRCLAREQLHDRREAVMAELVALKITNKSLRDQLCRLREDREIVRRERDETRLENEQLVARLRPNGVTANHDNQ